MQQQQRWIAYRKYAVECCANFLTCDKKLWHWLEQLGLQPYFQPDSCGCALSTWTKVKGAAERGYDLSAARWGTLRWFSRCQWSPEGTLHLLFHPWQTFQLHLLHKGRSPAAVWRLARKTGPLLYKLKDVEYTVHSVVGSLQFQFTTKKWDRQPLLGKPISFFRWGYFATVPFITTLPYSLGETLSASVPAAHRPALRHHWL